MVGHVASIRTSIGGTGNSPTQPNTRHLWSCVARTGAGYPQVQVTLKNNVAIKFSLGMRNAQEASQLECAYVAGYVATRMEGTRIGG